MSQNGAKTLFMTSLTKNPQPPTKKFEFLGSLPSGFLLPRSEVGHELSAQCMFLYFKYGKQFLAHF